MILSAAGGRVPIWGVSRSPTAPALLVLGGLALPVPLLVQEAATISRAASATTKLDLTCALPIFATVVSDERRDRRPHLQPDARGPTRGVWPVDAAPQSVSYR